MTTPTQSPQTTTTTATPSTTTTTTTTNTTTTPSHDKYYMPAEWTPHEAVWLLWPYRKENWRRDALPAQKAYAAVVAAILKTTPRVFVGVPPYPVIPPPPPSGGGGGGTGSSTSSSTTTTTTTTTTMLDVARATLPDAATIVPLESDDAWARDTGPTIVVKRSDNSDSSNSNKSSSSTSSSTMAGEGETRHEERRAAVSWCFNSWGGAIPGGGLFKTWDRDQQIAPTIAQYHTNNNASTADSPNNNVSTSSPVASSPPSCPPTTPSPSFAPLPCYHADNFILEGGSIHVDGEGTLLTTRECLLNPNRNPHLSQSDIEQKLRDYLGVRVIIWLPWGVYCDETSGHVDNMACFARPGEVVLAWTDDSSDPQYERSAAALELLEATTDARGRRIKVHKLPLPSPQRPIMTISEEDCEGLLPYNEVDPHGITEAAQHVPGSRMAGSYVNFLITNRHVIFPYLGDAASDQRAEQVLRSIFSDYMVTGVPAREILLGGGNIHCITQQIPL